ncbi:MAG: restriction endonuclease subunit S [Desulfobulbaceae bacterium]|nr:restriction endonuclease subunit S [Desulfobulbaceae bacterium]
MMQKKETIAQGSLPNLRFPEFQGDWENKRLGGIAEVITEKAGNQKYTLMSITSGVGLVSQMEKFGREIAGAQYKNYLVIREDDFAYNKSATKEHPEGFIAMYSGEDAAAVPNSIFTCLRVQDSTISPQYLKYLFLGNLHGKWLRKFIAVGARAHGSLNVDNEDLLSLPVPLPGGYTSLDEQKKIADCLSSVDELITAQSQKLETLKTHKKGLMQKLFPSEGETQPNLRFPEFQDAGKWVEKKLDGIADLYKGKGISKADIDVQGQIPCIRYGELYTIYSEVIQVVFSKTSNPPSDLFLSRKNDVIIPASGETKIDIAKASCVMHDNVALGGDLNVIRSRHNGVFLSYYLNGPKKVDIAKIAQGDSVVHLYPSQLKLLEIRLPVADEQQKIANCLSSIDELITAQTQKLGTLKTHKKGLMQQLFPVLDEVLG